ncbi:unnamed protein product [Didymodactylos carnosus]|uniref:Uncharacterized protein n=1 Tax=Didymodactylos carnosus TaxID=1234261 RepID=A0A814NKQ7_9BILA|nr:unnamed protein product [Didymodactylos carnosus]CAF3860477.1 unnamed protein product [Didymodactylos carnosus]
MLITLILSFKKDNEEDILQLEPSADLKTILTNAIGDLNQYIFRINNKEIAVNDLVHNLSFTNNMIIDVQPIPTRGVRMMLLGNRGMPLEIKSSQNPQKPTIKIESVHLSCLSDIYQSDKDIVGMIVYSYNGQSDFRLNGKHCTTGYILIKETKNIQHTHSNQGQVHGKLFKWFFDEEADEKFVGGGFALRQGKLIFHSGVFNARIKDEYHDGDVSMHQCEKYLIRYVVDELYVTHRWRQSQNLSVRKIDRSEFARYEHLPIQNHPKIS